MAPTSILPTLPTALVDLTYQTVQQGISAFSLAHKMTNTRLLQWLRPRQTKSLPLSEQTVASLQRRMSDLLTEDWQDAERGVYPLDLLFDRPWPEFLAMYPLLCLDTLATWERAMNKQGQSFSETIDTEGYPTYYLQNFHYQTDGYLSDQSADLYDLQVELLFNGGADAMRRRILAPIATGLAQTWATTPSHQIRVLDVACGTGRSLYFLRSILPKAALYGVDLSPAYLRKAQQWHSARSAQSARVPQLLQANAEALPFVDRHFHAVTSTFLFHELPPEARQNTINEMARVIQPGGVLVLCDSIQLADAPELAPVLENFPSMFHEPYYGHYASDDLVDRLTRAGFTDIVTTTHFMSKYWVARKA